MVDAVTWELFGASSCEDEVALQTGVYDLGDDVLVCEADDKAVLRGVARKPRMRQSTWKGMCRYILLVLGLANQPLAGVVCGPVSTCAFAGSGYGNEQSVLPSLRRRYLTWKREKYAFVLMFFWKGI